MTSRRPVNRVTSKRRPTAPSDATRSGGPSQSATSTSPSSAKASVSKAAAVESDASPSPSSKSAEQPSRSGATRATPTRKPRLAGASRSSGDRVTADPPRPAARAKTRGRRGPGRAGPGRSYWPIAASCLIAALLLGGFAVAAAAKPGVDTANQAYLDNASTEEVRAAAEHALKTIYAYDVKNIDGYRDAARQVVTGKMLTDLDKFADTTVTAVKQAQTSADAKADPIAVTVLTDDRAELLVNLLVSATKDGVAQQSVAGPVVLHMQRVDGHWLANDIVDQ